jgi:hypothetical protein
MGCALGTGVGIERPLDLDLRRTRGETRGDPLPPHLAGQALVGRLFLPVRAHVDMATTRPALGADSKSAPRLFLEP